MRIFIALAAFALCFAVGTRKSLLLKRRVTLLEELVRLLNEFAIEIRCTAPTLDELCGQARGSFAEMLRECREESTDIKSAWEKACGQLSQLSCCGTEEYEIMLSLGQSLGTCDVQGQLSLLELHSEKLSSVRQAAADEYARKGKLMRSVGALCGIGAAILIV